MDNTTFYMFMVSGFAVLLLYVSGAVKAFQLINTETPGAVKRFVWHGLISIPLVIGATISTTFAGLGPGAWLYLASIVVTPLFGWRIVRAKNYFTSHTNDTPQSWRFISTIVAFGLLSAPFIAEWGIAQQCDYLHTQQLQPIIEVVEQYRDKQGRYPQNLEEVTSGDEGPHLSCFIGATGHYGIEECDTTFVLMLDNLTGGFVIRYNFVSREWVKVDRLDGSCSFLD